MNYVESRSTLVKVAIALVLSIGLSVANTTYAAVDMFMKIEDIDGEAEAKLDPHDAWIEVEAMVQGKKLILKNKKEKNVSPNKEPAASLMAQRWSLKMEKLFVILKRRAVQHPNEKQKVILEKVAPINK